MKKYILVFVFVAIAVIITIVLRGFKGSVPTNIEDVKCAYPVTVSGQAMEPAIKAGSRLFLSKCFKDKQNMPAGTVIMWEENGTNRLGRIKEKVILQEGVFYKIGRDARQGEEFTVAPDKILASDEK